MSGLIDTSEIRKSVVANLGLSGLSEEYQTQIIQELEINISKKLQLEVFKVLSDDDRREFETVSALAVADEPKKFLESKIKDFENFAKNVAKEVVEQFKTLRDTPPEDIVEEESYELGNPDA